MKSTFSSRAISSASWVAKMDFPALERAKRTVFSPYTMRPWQYFFGIWVFCDSSIQALALRTERRPSLSGARRAFSTSAVIASIGLMVSVVSILVGVKQFNSEVNIDHYFSSVLHTGRSRKAVFIALSCQVADAKEALVSLWVPPITMMTIISASDL